MATTAETTFHKRPRRRRHVQPRPSDDLCRRARVLLRTEIDFVANGSFHNVDAELEEAILAGVRQAETGRPATNLPRGLPAHLARLCELDLLTAEQERELFFRMNYLKFSANVLRSRLDPQSPDGQAVDRCEQLLQAARMVRDQIIRANMRLVISIVRKFVTPQHSFDDMLSDGAYSLMQAVDKFDFARGFRFSTYAYRAIARNAIRTLADRHREANRFATGADDAIDEAVEDSAGSCANEQAWDRLREAMGGLLERLDRRERFIIRSRYALGGHRKVRTFQCLADKLGVSKERVRQLEQRAVAKLRGFVAEMGMDDVLETAMA